MNNLEKIKFREQYLFLLIIGLNLIPVLSNKYFPTLDGGPHVYNSQIIGTLLTESSSPLRTFYQLTAEPIPNWTGHVILTCFNYFLPAFLAEKFLLLTCLIGLPLSFRALVKLFAPQSMLLSYLIFPFTYSSLFFLGFFNFSLALVFAFVTLYYWIKRGTNFFGWRNYVGLSFLLIVTYFSHIFVFALLLFSLGFHVFFSSLQKCFDTSFDREQITIIGLKKLATLLICSAVPISLMAYYFLSRDGSTNHTYIPRAELITWLLDIRPIIALNLEIESAYTKPFFYLLCSLFALAFFGRIMRFKKLKSGQISSYQNLLHASDLWLFLGIIILVLYFVIPDTSASAGYISIRLGLIFFLLIILWLAIQPSFKWVGWITLFVTFYCHYNLNKYYQKTATELSETIVDIEKTSNYIAENSIVLPLNYTNNWFTGHFSNYLGMDKPLIILENYECGTSYFPVKWHETKIPNLKLGETPIDSISCVSWKSPINKRYDYIDYVFILGERLEKTDSCKAKLHQIIDNDYTLIIKFSSCQLFRKK